MMAKITHLTPEQEKKMLEFRDEWRAIGLATGPADIEAIRPSIDYFYKSVGEKPPIIWRCSSPLEANIMINLWPYLAKRLESLFDQMKAMRDKYIPQVFANVLRANIAFLELSNGLERLVTFPSDVNNTLQQGIDHDLPNIGNRLHTAITAGKYRTEYFLQSGINNQTDLRFRDLLRQNLRDLLRDIHYLNTNHPVQVAYQHVFPRYSDSLKVDFSKNLYDRKDDMDSELGYTCYKHLPDVDRILRRNLRRNLSDLLVFGYGVSIWGALEDTFQQEVEIHSKLQNEVAGARFDLTSALSHTKTNFLDIYTRMYIDGMIRSHLGNLHFGVGNSVETSLENISDLIRGEQLVLRGNASTKIDRNVSTFLLDRMIGSIYRPIRGISYQFYPILEPRQESIAAAITSHNKLLRQLMMESFENNIYHLLLGDISEYIHTYLYIDHAIVMAPLYYPLGKNMQQEFKTESNALRGWLSRNVFENLSHGLYSELIGNYNGFISSWDWSNISLETVLGKDLRDIIGLSRLSDQKDWQRSYCQTMTPGVLWFDFSPIVRRLISNVNRGYDLSADLCLFFLDLKDHFSQTPFDYMDYLLDVRMMIDYYTHIEDTNSRLRHALDLGQSIASDIHYVQTPSNFDMDNHLTQYFMDGNIFAMPFTSINRDLLRPLYQVLQNMLADTIEDATQDYMAGRDSFSSQSTYFWGSLDAYWIAYYLFPHLHLTPMHTDEQMEALNHWANLAKNCFWWYPYQNICFVCDRPSAIRMDEQSRLHDEARPSIEFTDGWKIYANHGVVLPNWVIEHPEQLSPEKINAEENTEVRRVMMQMYGYDKMFQSLGARCVSSHPNPTIGQLWKWEDKDGTRMAVVRVQNGTPNADGSEKWYTLRVRPQFTDVVEAVKSTYPACQNMTREEYLIMNGCRT